MNSSITVSKAQIDKKPFVLLQINALYDSISTDSDVLTIIPRDGKVNEIIKVLKYHQINYRGTHRTHPILNY